MEKDILDGKIGEVGTYDLEIKGGKLTFKASAGGKGVTVGVLAEADTDAVIDAVKSYVGPKIPGPVDEAFFDIIKAALKA